MKNKLYKTLNPFISKTDQHEISLNNITAESNIGQVSQEKHKWSPNKDLQF